MLDARATAVAAFYARGATAENLGWARHFDIAYVRIGPEEERAYGRGGSVAGRFEGWPVAFRAGAVRIVAVPR